MVTRVNWNEYKSLFPVHSDEEIASQVGVSTDAARLARKRYENPADNFIGLDIVYFDLETTGLTAIMGRLLCASFADAWGRVTTFRIDQTERVSKIDDRELALKIRDQLETYDVIVGHNSKLFDVSFLNARLLRWDERPLRKDLKHIDTMYLAGIQNVKIGSRKLVNIQKFSNIENEKSEVDWDTWALAGLGDKEAMEEVIDHCERDVLVLREVFGKLKAHVVNIHR